MFSKFSCAFPILYLCMTILPFTTWNWGKTSKNVKINWNCDISCMAFSQIPQSGRLKFKNEYNYLYKLKSMCNTQ